MAGAKETPRQKMIGMMYLVLTALLALNVSKEILDAFIYMDEGLKKTYSTLESNSNSLMSQFGAKNAANPEKVGPFMNAAQQVETEANNMYDYIEEMKARILATSHKGNKKGEGFEEFMEEGGEQSVSLGNREVVKKPDENQNNTTLLIGPDPKKPRQDPFSAWELQSKLEGFRDALTSITFSQATGEPYAMADNEGLVSAINDTFSFPDQKEGDKEDVPWIVANFYHSPLAAVIAQLSKLQVDVEKTKVDVLNNLYGGIDAESYKFTTLKPLVIPKSNYVLRGDTFRAQVLLAAYDATNTPRIFVGNEPQDTSDKAKLNTDGLEQLPINLDGLGELKIPTNGMGLGEKTFRGEMFFQGPDGNDKPFSFWVDPFTVAEPALVVSPTKMNVFYRGLPNPVEVSVPGIPSDKLSVTCSGGHQLSKGSKGEWVVKPGKGKEAVISVSATMPDGSKKSIGKKDFRVKRIPDPVPEFAKKRPSDNTVKKADMTVAAGVIARMDNFDFEVDVKVKSFNMIFIRDGQVIEKKSSSNRITEEMKANMKKVGKGQKIYIEKITVKMPDGSTRQVSNISLKVV